MTVSNKNILNTDYYIPTMGEGFILCPASQAKTEILHQPKGSVNDLNLAEEQRERTKEKVVLATYSIFIFILACATLAGIVAGGCDVTNKICYLIGNPVGSVFVFLGVGIIAFPLLGITAAFGVLKIGSLFAETFEGKERYTNEAEAKKILQNLANLNVQSAWWSFRFHSLERMQEVGFFEEAARIEMEDVFSEYLELIKQKNIETTDSIRRQELLDQVQEKWEVLQNKYFRKTPS